MARQCWRAAESFKLRDKRIRSDNRPAFCEYLFAWDTVSFGIGIEAGVANYRYPEIQIVRSGDGRKDNTAGGNTKENQIFNAACAKRQAQMVFRESAGALFIDEQVAYA